MSAPVIETHGLGKRFGTTVGIADLDLTVEPGEIFGFLGPNGAGKTTTIRLLLDLIRPTTGTAFLFGTPARERGVRGRVGYLPGELALDGRLTGAQTLAFLHALVPARDRPARRRELCQRFDLGERILGRRVRDYSRGMKQKLGLVSAFEHDPDLLILDEPTTGLDPLMREALFELLVESRMAGRTVFHSSHVLSEVDRACDRVAILREGRLRTVLDIAAVRRTAARRMAIRFAAAPPLAELALEGIEVAEVAGHRVVLRIRGGLDPLLAVLARHAVVDLAFPEPSLEDAFIDFYRDGGGGA